jgi:hypothetical protein
LFYEALRVQLISKNIIRAEEWEDLRREMTFIYDQDNHFTELKNNEILMQRVQMLQQMEQYVGKYYSSNWVKKNVLQLSDEEIKEMDADIERDRDQQLSDAQHQGNINTLVQPQPVDQEQPQDNTQQ